MVSAHRKSLTNEYCSFTGHLKLDRLELIVVDTEKNAKRLDIFENDAVNGPLFDLFGTHITPRMKEGKTKLGIF
jgi:protein CMS1